jgi:hypothetical protein
MWTEAFSPIMMAAAFVLPEQRSGITDASAIRRPDTPRTRKSGCTTVPVRLAALDAILCESAGCRAAANAAPNHYYLMSVFHLGFCFATLSGLQSCILTKGNALASKHRPPMIRYTYGRDLLIDAACDNCRFGDQPTDRN